MAGAAQNMNPTLIERADVHKSCKTLETIVNVFNDYCQAAESLSLVQKKLSKALKDASGMKATNDLAGNALNVVAQLLDALAEVDTKFVKIADKECDEASNDVKKWFKKLAKEEKNHDERIAATNAKIKQAGQQYEKKAKKKDLSAAEEHARYVNLLSVVGPELSQEKYNHSLLVSQRHTSTIYSVTSSISRVADAEWQRACECVRRFSPLIGRIGECRAFIEGGWINDPPAALPPPPTSNDVTEKDRALPSDQSELKSNPSPSTSSVSGHSGQRTPAPAYSLAPSMQTREQTSQSQVSLVTNESPTQHRPPPSSFNAATERFNADSVRSIESLSSFPAPPAHFPIPSLSSGPGPSPLSQVRLPSGSPEVDELGRRSNSGYFGQGTHPAASLDPPTNRARTDRGDSPINELAPVVESPISLSSDLKPETPALTEDSGRSPIVSQRDPQTPRDGPTILASSLKPLSSENSAGEQDHPQRIVDTRLDAVDSTAPQRIHAVNRKASATEQINEFGQRPQGDSGKISMERSESITSTASVVASMRDKLTRGYAPSPSPKDRDIPRVTGKVSDLASRYTPVGDQPPSPISPRATGRNSPVAERTRVSPALERRSAPNESIGDQSERDTPITMPSPHNQLALSNTRPLEDEIMARRRRIAELEELERREQAHVLRLRERELEQRTFEIQREREQLQEYRARPRVNSVVNGVKGAVQLPARPHSQYSYSTTNLPNPRTPTATEAPSRPVSQYGELAPPMQPQASASSSSVSIPRPPQDHAPYCGCYACSAAQYSAAPRAQPQPTTDAKPEKPKGWIRRLSMPVGNAFTSDPKSNKGISNKGIGLLPDDPMLRMKPSFERDATGGISNVRPRKLSFGRR